MIVSTFDPFTADPAKLLDWLRQRNRLDGDDLVNDNVIPVSGIFHPGLSLGLAPRLLLLADVIPSWRLLREFRTSKDTIGVFSCDLITAMDRVMLWNSLLVRAIVLTVATCAGLALGIGGWGLGLLLLMAWSQTVWRGRFAFPLVAAILGVVAWYNISALPAFAVTAGVCGLVRLLLWFVRSGIVSIGLVDSPVRFLGRAFLVRARWDRTASSVLLAVAKATYDDRARASIFVDDCIEQAPARLRPVLVQCQALVAAGELEFQQALRLSEQARDLAVSAPAEIRGWCALQSGDVLLAAGQPAAAERRWQESVEHFRRSRRAGFWSTRAELRLIEAQTADLADPERCLLGLRTLHRVRRNAVRAGNLELLVKTERYLLRLMYSAGNTVGVVVHLIQQHEQTGGRGDLGASVADHATETLLLATLYLDIAEHPDRYPEDVQVDESDQSRYDFVGELVDNVLRHLSRSMDPLLEAQAYAILARAQAAKGQPEEALGNALESLNVVQRVRYQLPTAQWRSHWLAAHAHTYALALELSATADATLVAELLETVRAQSIPLESDQSNGFVRAAFDSLLAATGLPLSAALAADALPVTTDPLLTDRTILVAGASWVGGDDGSTIDLDAELEAMFPQGWYWSFAKVDDWVYHAVRSPAGTWYAERRPFTELEAPLAELLQHLPVEQPDDEGLRLALTAERANEVMDPSPAGEVWSRLFADLGRILIPLRLRAALQSADELLRLVVAPTASLVLVPIAALSLGDGRHVLDAAYVAHLPSLALLAQRRSQLTDHQSAEESPARVLAVLAPHLSPEDPDLDLPHAVADPPVADQTLTGPLEKNALAGALPGCRLGIRCSTWQAMWRLPTFRIPAVRGLSSRTGRWGCTTSTGPILRERRSTRSPSRSCWPAAQASACTARRRVAVRS